MSELKEETEAQKRARTAQDHPANMWWRRNWLGEPQVEHIFYLIMLNSPLTRSALSHFLTHWFNKCCDLNMLTDTDLPTAYSNIKQYSGWEAHGCCLSPLCVFRSRAPAQLLGGGAFPLSLGDRRSKLEMKLTCHPSNQVSLQEAHYWKYLSFLELNFFFFHIWFFHSSFCWFYVCFLLSQWNWVGQWNF